MSGEKQIAEMAVDINDCITEFVTDVGDVYIDDEATAQKMFDKGYRKIQTTDWLTKGISKEQLEREKDESLKEFFDGNCKKYGYYKQSEVVREIIGEILLNHTPDIDGFFIMHESELAEFKKKYTEESGNDR